MFENKKTLKDVNFKNKTVVARLDYNVPIKDGVIRDNKRIVATIPTINYLLDNNCKIVILSHLSKIKTIDDIKSNKKTLAPVAKELQKLLGNTPVHFLNKNTGKEVEEAVKNLKAREILILENTRYNDVNENNEVVKLESKCNNDLGKFWASLGDVYVNDAFGTAHRKHASNAGIAKNIKESCIGFLIEKELANLSKAVDQATHPYVAIVGGAKVSDKLKVIHRLLEIADKVIITGGMVFTFHKAKGYNIGKSLCEDDMIEEAKNILAKGANKIVLANDFYCAPEFADVKGEYRHIEQGLEGLMGLDSATESAKAFEAVLKTAKTVVWNGPSGVFEFSNYQYGTKNIAETLKAITKKGAFTVLGGGDTASSAVALGFKETDFSFVSTGGGASLSLIEGSELFGISSISDK